MKNYSSLIQDPYQTESGTQYWMRLKNVVCCVRIVMQNCITPTANSNQLSYRPFESAVVAAACMAAGS